MFVGLTNEPRDYAWGSTTAIADLLGRPRSGKPEAEYWLGTHPGSPSQLLDPEDNGGATLLSQLTTLPYLLKVLAADAPLSLQAHPTSAQAQEGFDRENAEGIPIDSPNRNYRDNKHKPELIYALSDEFVALCGFRSVPATRALFETLGDDPAIAAFCARLVDDESLKPVLEWLLSRSVGVAELLELVVGRSSTLAGAEFGMVGELAAGYPGDPGIVVALLLNRVVLSPGQALYLPAGNIHAYLKGVGIELMSASDNVLRGGLTPKHVDVPELIQVLDFTSEAPPFLTPDTSTPGLHIFRPNVREFELVVVRPTDSPVSFELPGAAILLCTAGEFRVEGSRSAVSLVRGDSVYVTVDEGSLVFSGAGTVFLASANSESVDSVGRRNEKNL
ncbi:MAG TPA: mannose-6-phosphate isomerase, class I [Galbitalea sp.]|jgi:mannose-6-phosphate isomerase|nr:mannose-6-phosphate isomerase, class I [Galbitalea sp.]